MIKKFTFIPLLLLLTTKVWCQIVVSGKVILKDDKSSLPWIQIIEKGTKNATNSKEDGTFSINVSDSSATLVFSLVGMVTQEYHLKGANEILIKMKMDCIRCFFDVQEIGIYANSGVLNNQVGGQLHLTFPRIYGSGTLKSTFSLQSNLRNNQFLNAQVEFIHFALKCEFDMNARWHYREVSYNNNFRSKASTFETDVNFARRIWFLPYLGITLGYGNLNLTSDNQSITGPVIGLSTYIRTWRFYLGEIRGKVGIFGNNIEWQGQFTRRFKGFNTFIKYYQLKSFSELSLGIGGEFGYRFKRQRMRK